MPAVTIRNLPEATHRALKVRAARHGRSTEAEIRFILEVTVHDKKRVKLGSLLASIGQEVGGIDLNIKRDRKPSKPVSFR
ncbi:MAG: plasmid stability protein [Acidobacteriaceae bacterium]|nr:plasmid stability protein [Acidobacteriaceae bacterium]